MEAFDAPALQTSCARRESSTHAPQALELLNGQLANDLAAVVRRADSRARNPGGDRRRASSSAPTGWRLGRPPTPDEREALARVPRDQPLREFALALFNLNAFLYVP